MLQLLAARSDAVAFCREIITSIIGDETRMTDIDFKLKKFKNRYPLDIPFDVDSFRAIVERAVVLSDRRIRFYFITGEIAEFPMPLYSKIANNLIEGSILEKSVVDMSRYFTFTN